MAESRQSWVDIAKGIGIVLVVYGHVVRGWYGREIPAEASIYGLVDSVLYLFHMPLFFFLSGVFFMPSLRRHGGLGLMRGKVETILYPYVLWTIIQGSIGVGLSKFALTNRSVSIGDILSLGWRPIDQFWFLYALFGIYLVAVCCGSIRERLTPWLLVGVGALLYAAQTALSEVPLVNYISPYLLYFALGAVSPAWFEHPGSRPWLVAATTMLMAVLAQIIFHGYAGWRYDSVRFNHEGLFGYALPVTLLSLLAAVCLSRALSCWRLPWLVYLGTASMGIYLMHTLVSAGLRVGMTKLLGLHSEALYLIVGTAGGLVVPLVVLWFLERRQITWLIRAPAWMRKFCGARD
jgi:fucose 4-O-acetylase-like acetyltransferase